MVKILEVPLVLQVNGKGEWNRQDSKVQNIFRETDPRRGVGWVLIAMGGSVICDIGRSKSKLRNRKNKNFEISESWNDVSESWNDVSESWNDVSSFN